MIFHGNKKIIMAISLLVVIWLGCNPAYGQTAKPNSPDMLAIQGRWVRNDAPYVIELSQTQPGTLQATYFNSRLINVDKTEIAEKDGFLYVLITLDDINYRGSAYLLAYNRAEDALQGTYFHAGSQKTYEVGFIRRISTVNQ